jgi:hypothetical protein
VADDDFDHDDPPPWQEPENEHDRRVMAAAIQASETSMTYLSERLAEMIADNNRRAEDLTVKMMTAIRAEQDALAQFVREEMAKLIETVIDQERRLAALEAQQLSKTE